MGQPHGGTAEISARLVEQVTSVGAMGKIHAHPAGASFTRFIELGPGTALSVS